MCVSWSSGQPWEGAEFFSRVTAGDESWILEYDHETKRKSQEWHSAKSPRPKKREWANSNSNRFSFFLIIRRSSTRNLCHQDKLSIKLFYREVLASFRKIVARVRPGTAPTWMQHHDNAPCHTAISINEFLAEKSIYGSSAPLFAGSQSLWFLFILPTQKALGRVQFWYFG